MRYFLILLFVAAIAFAGGWTTYREVNGKLRVSSTPEIADVAKGHFLGRAIQSAFGQRWDVQVVTAGSDVWDGVATRIPYPADAGEQLKIMSSSDEDSTGNTGATRVHVHFLDAAGAEQAEYVTMTGTAPVVLTETNVRYVQEIHVDTVGSAGVNIGNITVYQQTDTTIIYEFMKAGVSRSMSCKYMVPAGKTFYITNRLATSTEKSVAIQLMTNQIDDVADGLFLPYCAPVQLKDAAISMGGAPITVNELVKIRYTVFVPAGKNGADVSAGFQGWTQ